MQSTHLQPSVTIDTTKGPGNLTAREGEVENQCADLRAGVANVSNLVSQVYARLGNVLKPIPEIPPKDGVPEIVLCPLAGWIRDDVKNLRHIAANLEELLGRIEL